MCEKWQEVSEGPQASFPQPTSLEQELMEDRRLCSALGEKGRWENQGRIVAQNSGLSIPLPEEPVTSSAALTSALRAALSSA